MGKAHTASKFQLSADTVVVTVGHIAAKTVTDTAKGYQLSGTIGASVAVIFAKLLTIEIVTTSSFRHRLWKKSYVKIVLEFKSIRSPCFINTKQFLELHPCNSLTKIIHHLSFSYSFVFSESDSFIQMWDIAQLSLNHQFESNTNKSAIFINLTAEWNWKRLNDKNNDDKGNKHGIEKKLT